VSSLSSSSRYPSCFSGSTVVRSRISVSSGREISSPKCPPRGSCTKGCGISPFFSKVEVNVGLVPANLVTGFDLTGSTSPSPLPILAAITFELQQIGSSNPRWRMRLWACLWQRLRQDRKALSVG